jgi:phosphatidylinositol alpha-1,6-mannosyltransferase
MYARCKVDPKNLVVLAADHEDAWAFDKDQLFTIYRFRYSIYPPKWIPSFMEPFRQFLKLVQSFFVLWRFLSTEKYQICEIATPFPGALAVNILFPRNKVRLISYALGDDIIRPQRHWYSAWLFRQSLKRVDLFVAISHYTKGLLLKADVPEDKIVVVYPPFNKSVFNEMRDRNKYKDRLPLHDLMLLTICRLSWKKGVDQVIKIMPNLLKKFPNLIYVVGGEGPYEKELRVLTDEHNVSDRVIFLGRVDDADIVDLYASSDVFIMPTREDPMTGSVEGFGIVFLEAGSQKVPVIGPCHGGSSDAIEDGITGFLVTPDNLIEIEDKISLLLLDPELRETMGKAGRMKAMRMEDWSPILNFQ